MNPQLQPSRASKSSSLEGLRPRRQRQGPDVLAEEHDEWAIARRYMSLESLTQARIRLIEPDHLEEVTPALESAIG